MINKCGRTVKAEKNKKDAKLDLQLGFCARLLAPKPVPGGRVVRQTQEETSEKDACRVARKVKRSCRDSRVPSLCVHSLFQRQVNGGTVRK